MDPVTIALATAVAGGVGGKIGEALAGGGTDALKRLRRALFQRFAARPEAQAALMEAQADPDDTAAVEALAGHIRDAETADPGIAPLAAELRALLDTRGGNQYNTIYGDVNGIVVQGRDNRFTR